MNTSQPEAMPPDRPQQDLLSILQNVTDEMLEGLQVIGRDWRYLYVNETVANQGKTTKEALLGRTMMERYPGIEKTPFWTQIKKCMEERINVRMENEFVFPDGTSGWFELFMHPVTEGVLILSIDITKKKRMQEELAKKVSELDELMRLTVNREQKMVELKRALENLKALFPPGASKIEHF